MINSISNNVSHNQQFFFSNNFDFKKISNLANQLFKSYLLLATFLGVLTIGSGLLFLYTSNVALLHVSAISLISLGILIKKRPLKLLYELSITDTYVRYFINEKKWPWYNKINSHLYLGAIPLKNLDHENIFLKKENIKAVLSLVEPFEEKKKTIFSIPVKRYEWIENNINYLNIKVKDAYPLTLDEIDKAADFINENISKDKKVYVHCKAGRSRSASAIIGYLIKYKKMKLHQAINFVKKRRNVVILNFSQFKALENFYKKVRLKTIINITGN
ncbi:MAG: dual specificity protein phosphatase family protein [Parachlamydiales bacterium]|nr:dual specificity protein phosphatase family protein [Parachlamydiales bacterium]